MEWVGSLTQVPNSHSFVVTEGDGEAGCAQKTQNVRELLLQQSREGLVCSFQVQIRSAGRNGRACIGLAPPCEFLPLSLDGGNEAERARRCFFYSSSGDITANLCSSSSSGCLMMSSEPFGAFDTVGWVVDMRQRHCNSDPALCTVTFTRNGRVVGEVPATREAVLSLRPSATLAGAGTMATFNVELGVPHMFGASSAGRVPSLTKIAEDDSCVEAGLEHDTFTIAGDDFLGEESAWVWEEDAGGRRSTAAGEEEGDEGGGALDTTWGSFTLNTTRGDDGERVEALEGKVAELQGLLARARRESKVLQSRAAGERDASQHELRRAREERERAESELAREGEARRRAQQELKDAVELLKRAESELLQMREGARGLGAEALADALEGQKAAEQRALEAVSRMEEVEEEAEEALGRAEVRAQASKTRMQVMTAERDAAVRRAEEAEAGLEVAERGAERAGAEIGCLEAALKRARGSLEDAQEAMRGMAGKVEAADAGLKEAQEGQRRMAERASVAEAQLEEERLCREQLGGLVEEERAAGRRLRERLGELTAAVRRRSEEEGGGAVSVGAALEEAMLRFAEALSERPARPPPQAAAHEALAFSSQSAGRASLHSLHAEGGGRTSGSGCASAAAASSSSSSPSGRAPQLGVSVARGPSPLKVHGRLRETPGGAQSPLRGERDDAGGGRGALSSIAPPPSDGPSPSSLMGRLVLAQGGGKVWAKTPNENSHPQRRLLPTAPSVKNGQVPLPGGRATQALKEDGAQPRAAEPDANGPFRGLVTLATISPRVLFAGKGAEAVGEAWAKAQEAVADQMYQHVPTVQV